MSDSAFHPTADGEVDGYCDATTRQPPQPAMRFAEVMSRYDGDEWPFYFHAYMRAYRSVSTRQSTAFSHRGLQ